MIYFKFKNYDEFKEIFGIIEHGNGVKSRKNKILLALYKDKNAFRHYVKYLGTRSMKDIYENAMSRVKNIECECTHERRKHLSRWLSILNEAENRYGHLSRNKFDLLGYSTLVSLKKRLLQLMGDCSLFLCSNMYIVNLNGKAYYSNLYETDDFEGLCEDGTVNAIRYVNIEKGRVFKMKAGKMFNHLMQNNAILRCLPEQIQRWLSEEFVADWIQYATEKLSSNEYTLHVNDNFKDIYDPDCCKGYDVESDCFHSCMVGDNQHTFYEDSVAAEAAYLEDGLGMIVARCIIFTDVMDDKGNTYRLAERQYSYKSDLSLQRQLISALIRGGYIDGYKKVGASCHDSRAFVDNQGNSLADVRFHIRCTIKYGDTLSYQDSFKWLDIDEGIAYNYDAGGSLVALDETNSELNGPDDDHDSQCWSSYNEEYIDENDAYYVESRQDYFYYYQTVEAEVRCNGSSYYERCFENDCIEINGTFYFAGTDCDYYSDYGIAICDRCDEYYLTDDGSYHSELTDGDYCCSDCMERAEDAWYEDHGYVKSEYDEAWYEEADVVTAIEWRYNWRCGYTYIKTTISKESLDSLIEDGEATWFNGVPYIDAVGYDGEPLHILAAELLAA